MTDVAREYAFALFELASEENKTKEIFDELNTLNDAFAENGDYLEFLASPGIPKDERIAAVGKLTDGFEEYVCSFISLLVEHGHILDFFHCVKEYTELYNESNKISKAYDTSAVELTKEQQDKLKDKLEKLSKHRVELILTADSHLLAGLTVDMDDTVIDGSLKRRLQNIREVINK